ncbi:ABC-2 type transport system permease protein [Mariniphaga anaerophila]|uniref:ABC-2 type transport system permease protein n=1 Tax=Mariniphaga anaerophila TaxID=1484053 RepID=A0A1M5AEB9_9BACT|nr:ABC transporter permease [Mariniphaga anaerophila]SHF28620.1 ABC-2 type transport system permease protein [Mariniphaga anaerophila]
MKEERKHPLLSVIDREAERIKHNPAYRFLLFGGPLIGILLLFFIFRQGAVKELPLAVVDQDHSSLSVKIINALNSSPDVEVVFKVPDLFLAKEMLEKGQVDAVVFIPENLEKSVFKGTKAELPVYVNGTNVLVSGLIQRSVLTTLRTVSGGIQLKKLMLTGKNKQEAMTRVLPINIQKHVLFNPYTNYSYFLNSAMLYVMLYLFVLLSSIYTLGNELKRGTGHSLLETSNNSVRLAVAGKMFSYTIIFSGFAMLINFLLYKMEGMPLNGSYWVIFVGQFITIITYQLMGLIFVGVTINLRLALSLASAYSMMGITFSGLTLPLEAMPKIAQWFAALFPFTWWEKIMISQSLRGAPVKDALPYICYILIFQLVALAFLKVYKRYLENPKYWGKK